MATKKRQILKIFGSILLAIFIAACAGIIFFNITHSYYIVLGPSMTPTLNQGVTFEDDSKDGVFVSKIKSYKRGDIVVANKNYGVQSEAEKDIIKRIIAIEGDKIKVELVDEFYRIILWESGQEESYVLNEPYLESYSLNNALYTNFYIMVDEYNIQIDTDGFITIPENNVFYLGDNRPGSIDCSIYGPKPKKCIIGKVDYIIYGNKNLYLQVIKQFFGW